MNESEVRQAKINRYRNQIAELQRGVTTAQREIAVLEGFIHSLQEMDAYERGEAIERTPRPVTRLVEATGEDDARRPRGWLKGKIVEYVKGVATKPFTGRDVAEWIRNQGNELTLPQYNRIFTELTEMAKKGEEIERQGKAYVKLSEVAPGLHTPRSETESGKTIQEGE